MNTQRSLFDDNKMNDQFKTSNGEKNETELKDLKKKESSKDNNAVDNEMNDDHDKDKDDDVQYEGSCQVNDQIAY